MGWIKKSYLKFPTHLFPLLILFMLVNSSFLQIGGYNPSSRLALMAALTEDFSVAIDRYAEGNAWTNDWALGVDGHKVSNKAPGAAFLGFPIYYLLDLIWNHNVNDLNQRDENRFHARHLAEFIISWLLQILTFSILMLWAFALGPFSNISSFQQIALFSVLSFAQTISLFFNTFFGHALLGVISLTSYFCFINKKYFCAGLLAALSVAVDYSSAPWLLVLSMAFVFLKDHRRWKSVIYFALGVVPIFLFLGIYHKSAFGTPFTLSLQHQNPSFKNTEAGALWGILNLLPSFTILMKLLFGMERGILWTQPWLFVLIYKFGVLSPISLRQNYFFKCSLIYFLLLLFLNAGFGGWHSGGSPGPRYLSVPIFLMSAFFPWSSLKLKSEVFLKILIGYSFFFYCCVMSTELLLPAENLWLRFFRLFSEKPSRILKLLVLMSSFVYMYRLSFRRALRQES
ncbi:MAG: hypothetical protein KA116_00115 [Proteobacteria bacterium]|nr:hypothetical protein [Pseudomonadota bacterium]